MPKKSFKKKKGYQFGCMVKVKREGLTNTASGGWERATSARMSQMMVAGYKVR